MKKIIFIVLVSFSNCSSLQLDKHDGFWDWLKGKPGYENSKEVGERKGVILGERHPYYLWFRTPELIFNPQGGLYYPDMIMEHKDEFYETSDLSKIENEQIRNTILYHRNEMFNLWDAGLIDYGVQYRELIDPSGKIYYAARNYVSSYLLLAVLFPIRLVVYVFHDITKTIMIPATVVYYLTEDNNKEGE
ncbi:MAG: hypothetical protein KDK90_27855 [Leptospiraceae bacterium]|nr:hypothetical protein [Leptospiraceae bacterium]